MSILDVMTLACALLFALLVISRSKAARGAAVGVALLCVAQWLVEGYYWQLVPVYALLGVASLSTTAAFARTAVMRFAVRLMTGTLMLLLMLC